MIISIQYLRGFAALLVLLQHISFKLSRFELNPLGWLHAADIGVDVFFVISGFIMTHSVRKWHGDGWNIGYFLLRRVARIMPLYWLLTTVGLIVFLIAPKLVNSSGGDTQIIHSYLLIPTDAKYLVQNGWTLSYEFYFYIIFSLGIALPQFLGRLMVVVSLSILACAGLFLQPRGVWLQFILSSFLIEFAIGIILYIVFETNRRISRGVSNLIIVVAVVHWLFVNSGALTGERIFDYGLPAALLCAAMVLRRSFCNHREVKTLSILGDWSYSLYLIHPFIIAGLTIVMQSIAFKSTAVQLILGPLLLFASIVAAGVSYRWIELPLVSLAQRRLVEIS